MCLFVPPHRSRTSAHWGMKKCEKYRCTTNICCFFVPPHSPPTVFSPINTMLSA